MNVVLEQYSSIISFLLREHGFPISKKFVQENLSINQKRSILDKTIDFFYEYHIEHAVIELPGKVLEEVSEPCMYLDEGIPYCFLSVENNSLICINSNGKEQHFTIDDEKIYGLILIRPRNQNSILKARIDKEQKERKKRYGFILLSLLFYTLCISILTEGFTKLTSGCFYFSLKYIGLILSGVMMYDKHIQPSKVLGTICGFFTAEKSCSSKKELAIGPISISLTNWSWFYFMTTLGILLLLLFSNVESETYSSSILNLQFLSLLALLIIPVSIITQNRILKGICPICIIICLIILGENLVFYPNFHLPDHSQLAGSLSLLITALCISNIIYLIFIYLLNNGTKKSVPELQFYRSVSDSGILNTVLNEFNHVEPDAFDSDIVIGNIDEKESLLIVISLQCEYCKEVIDKALFLYEQSEKNYNIRIRVSHRAILDKTNNDDLKVLATLRAYIINRDSAKAIETIKYKMFQEEHDKDIAHVIPFFQASSNWEQSIPVTWTPFVICKNKVLPPFFDFKLLRYCVYL